MRSNGLLICVALLLQQNFSFSTSVSAVTATTSHAQTSQSDKAQSTVAQSSSINIRDASAAYTLGSLYRKSRQSRCVRCYEDRYGEDRSRGYGGYSGRMADDRSSWYYPSDRTYDRYEDRFRGGERDYDRYYHEYYGYNRDREDRNAPRTYDRYDGRGYEGRGYDRYEDRRVSQYDRGESRGYGYDNRERLLVADRYPGADRYSGSDRYPDYYGSGKSSDRYHDRSRGSSTGSGYGYDRDYYDRYYPRGQSGFDNSGRGYYFASNGDSRTESEAGRASYRPLTGGSPYLPQGRPELSPCGTQVPNCPHAGLPSSPGGSSYSTATSHTIYSGSHNGSGSTVISTQKGGASNGQSSGSNSGGWKYVNDSDSNIGGSRGDRDRDRDQQSSSYGGRPARPLGGSYLLDRDSNVVSEDGSSAHGAESKMTEDGSINMTGSLAKTDEAAVYLSENKTKESTN